MNIWRHFKCLMKDKRGVFPILPVLSGIGAIGSTVGGLLAGRSAANKADEQRALALRYLQNAPLYQYEQGTAPISYMPWEDVSYQTVQDSPEARAMEVENLKRMGALGREGMDEAMIRKYITGSRQAGEVARGGEEAIIKDMQRRGMAGAGTEIMARMIERQRAAQRVSEEQAAQAEADARLKAIMTEAAMRGAGALREQDIGLGEKNAAIINAFNELNSRARQQVAQQNIQLQNQYNQQQDAMRQAVNMGNVDLQRDLARQKANVAMGGAEQELQKGAGDVGMIRDIYGTLGTTLGGIYGQQNPTQTSGGYAPVVSSSQFMGGKAPGLMPYYRRKRE